MWRSDHALAFALRLLEVLQPFDMGQARQALFGPPPTHGHLKEGDTGGCKVFLEQMFTLLGGHLREAQFQVSRGNAPALTGHPVHKRTQHTTNSQQHAVWQLGNQPQHTEPQP